MAAVFAAQLTLANPVAMDADTLRAGGEIYRLAGVDAPEVGGRARCAAESAAGEAALVFVRARLAGAGAVVATPGHTPRDRRRTWPRDRYGRRLARVAVDGVDLGSEMIARGLALPWRDHMHVDWCADPPVHR